MSAGPDVLTLRPVAWMRTPYADAGAIPRGPGAEHRAEGWVEVREDLEAGLQDIEGFSHLILVWAFHLSTGFDLVVTPPTDDRPHGVFGTRSPRRPNPIGLTVVALLGREGPRLHVRGVDMVDATPVLDIKPYLSGIDPALVRRGWMEEAEARRAGGAR